MTDSCCHTDKRKPDYLLWGSLLAVSLLYVQAPLLGEHDSLPTQYRLLMHAVFELINTMWFSMVLGVLMVSVLAKIPREFVMSLFGTHKGLNGILRATAAGVLLDLCSHGILMVGSKLYERGASIGQVMAFLIASPWNSFSLTLILFALIGLPWTLLFIGLSMLIAIITGLLFEKLVQLNKLPPNPAQVALPAQFQFWRAAKEGIQATRFNRDFFVSMLMQGIKDSRMVMRWLFFGILLASLIKAFIPAALFGSYFGPTMSGLGLTMLAATLIEVCSEGSTPIAADLFNRANAPGNSFAFLMTGVATDYTEIMVVKETTQSWKIALLLPILTVPQVLVIAWIMNTAT